MVTLLGGSALAVAACGGDGGNDFDCGPFDSGACVAIEVVCPPDADQFTVSGLGGDEVEDCSVGGMAILVDAGDYDLFVTPRSSGFDFASDGEAVSVDEGDTVYVTFDQWPTGGFMGLTWTIADEDPAAGGCDDLSSGGVSSLATVVGTTEAYEDLFDCEAGVAVTAELPLDDYTVVVALLNQSDESIADSMPREVSLLVEDQFEDLGNFNFEP